ncbi:sugar ABC transporter permease [Paenibacillus sp. BC26]|uniref:ABC transporter permease n=1 Tax=Paenibacillus sp. BC26 TaxID=1881032 RepID=UPI0008E222FE|nr:ABC transporter permease subunit [Paenibacillus sp. BC26]SFS45582.1 putative aldouronate transport system permease protein [Paenibacillus sp. BC26]
MERVVKALQPPKTKTNRLSLQRWPVIGELVKNKTIYAMMLPGLLFILLFFYLPMFGAVIAFKEFDPIKGIWGSKWVGLSNFKFFFQSDAFFQVTFNTLFYNGIFLVTGIGLGLVAAILLNEIGNRHFAGAYKSAILLPFFLSWVVGSYLLYAFLSTDNGILNKMIVYFHGEPIDWYFEPSYWRFILPFAYIWKNVGYFAVFFAAGITTISPEYYEAAKIDGASRFQQALKITVPMLTPITIILVLLQAGKIFYAAFGDWGMFYTLPKDQGILFSATNVIDTYVYRALRGMNDFGMSSAIGFYQNCVGFVLIIVSNWIIRKYDRDSALF